MEGSPEAVASAPRRRGPKLLLGCAVASLVVVLLAVSSCVTFVWWVKRPGELLEPARLRGPETTAYVEWTLRMEDPGTAAVVHRLLGTLQRFQQRATPFSGALGRVLSSYQQRRNQRQLEMLFPCVVAWSDSPGSGPAEELQLFTVSIEKLGNRLVLMDWMLGWTLGRDEKTEVVSYHGERIYHLKQSGSAFLLRSGQFILTSDLDAAKRAVDRLRPEAPAPVEETGLDRLAAALPERALRGAATNERGEVRRLFAVLLDTAQTAAPPAVPWDDVRGATLAGGFGESSEFEAEIDLLVPAADDEAWIGELAGALGRSLSGETLPVHVEAALREDGVRFRVEIEDLPELLDDWLGKIPLPAAR